MKINECMQNDEITLRTKTTRNGQSELDEDSIHRGPFENVRTLNRYQTDDGDTEDRDTSLIWIDSHANEVMKTKRQWYKKSISPLHQSLIVNVEGSIFRSRCLIGILRCIAGWWILFLFIGWRRVGDWLSNWHWLRDGNWIGDLFLIDDGLCLFQEAVVKKLSEMVN